MNLFGAEAVQRVEAELVAPRSERSREREGASRPEEMWRPSERRHRHKISLAIGHAWIGYVEHLALCQERRPDEYKDKSHGKDEMVRALEGKTGGGGESY